MTNEGCQTPGHLRRLQTGSPRLLGEVVGELEVTDQLAIP
eukprot:CAMPEP_0195055700 /NCGR_PEP_ID=MMETSP0448-20130528/4317_1 /TAXON_ID=66468 /ORGANISM="Heterocapsa triquestra, Strain CCMP 448" /LENGTH=39 /DNA_ID= /DNA_START= /DNA_END= /DNA_ORIENTATION=